MARFSEIYNHDMCIVHVIADGSLLNMPLLALFRTGVFAMYSY